MPISVPKWARDELLLAVKIAKNTGYAMVTRDFYNAVKSHLTNKNVPHIEHRHEDDTPSDHVYWKP